MSLSVLFEDNHLLVVNKSSGTLVHGDKTKDEALDFMAKQYLKVKYHKPGNVFIGVCHRLDRPVSGAVILARTSKALARLNRQFRNQDVEKVYLAVSDRPPTMNSGVVKHYLIKDESKNMVKMVNEQLPGAKMAITSYKLLSEVRGRFLVLLAPQTGRPHQLRMAMKTIGAPILGDLKYGGLKISDRRRILLHCHQITIDHPTRNRSVTFEAPIPSSELWDNFRS